MIALARKYRPRKFSEVAVQEHVAGTLKGALASGRVAHGYLLSGPRGVGKTTLARVLAMALNCERGAPEGEPCGECASCTRIWQGSTSLDVVEIDAASNRGVDDARELRERAMYAPSGDDRYKVYIVDEAHMLTREAWNALLKVLEEPPPRVVFVFATTEPHRIAQAAAPVLSRLQRFDFRRMSAGDIRKRLDSVLAAEKVQAEPEALGIIARAADGSMRDALSLTDQVLAMGDGALSAARVREALGLVAEDEFVALLDIIAERRAKDVFPFVVRLAEGGVDFQLFLAGLGEMLRAQLAFALGGDAPDLSETARQALASRRDRIPPADLLRMLNAIGEIEIRFKRSGQQQLLIETLLVRFALLDRSVALEDVLRALGPPATGTGGSAGGTGGLASAGARQGTATSRPAGVTEPPRQVAEPRPAPLARPAPVNAAGATPQGALARELSAPAPVVTAAPTAAVAVAVPHTPAVAAAATAGPVSARSVPDMHAVAGRWDELIEHARATGKALLAAALQTATPWTITRNGELTIRLNEPNDFHARAIDQARSDLLAVLRDWFGGVSDLRVHREPAGAAAPEKPVRVTDDMVRAERVATLRRKHPQLDAAIEILDLDVVE